MTKTQKRRPQDVARSLTLLFLLAFVSGSCLGESPKMKDLKHSPWQEVSIDVFDMDSSHPSTIVATRTVYECNGMLEPVTSFISPRKHKVWVGPEEDFYIELDSGVTGGTLKQSGAIIWSDSLPAKTVTNNLHDGVTEFEFNCDFLQLEHAHWGAFDQVERNNQFTALRVSNLWAFTNGRYSSEVSHTTKLTSIEMEKGILKLKIENPASDFNVEAWIDPRTKMLIKAVEGPKVIKSPKLKDGSTHSPWQDTKIKLLVPGSANSLSKYEEVPAKYAQYQLDDQRHPDAYYVMLVHDPQAGKLVFIPAYCSFYISDRSGMTGYWLFPGYLRWTRSYLELKDPIETQVAVFQFENTCDVDQFFRESEREMNNPSRISLRAATSMGYFGDSPSPGGVDVQPAIEGIEMTNGVLRLDLRNPVTHIPASLWIDIPAGKVVRTVENGQEMDVSLPGFCTRPVKTPKLKDVRHFPWTDFPINQLVACSSNTHSKIERATAKYSCYCGDHWNEYPVLLIDVPQAGKRAFIKAGHQFYISDESGVIGCTLASYELSWDGSYFEMSITNQIDTATNQFENETDLGRLFDEKYREPAINCISMEKVALPFYVTNGKRAETKIEDTDLAGGLLRVNVRNLDTQALAIFWINIKAGRITRCTIDGKELDLGGS